MQFTVVDQHFAVKAAPGAEQIILFIDISPIDEFLDDIWEKIRFIDLYLADGG